MTAVTGAALNRGFEPTPPNNSDAEESVLGSLLIDPDSLAEISGVLQAGDFYHPRHRDVYAAMLRIAERGQPTDFVMVCDELERVDRFNAIGGVVYLSQILTTVPTSVHVVHYAEIVRRHSDLRRLISAGSRIAALGYEDTDDIDRTMSEASALLAAVTRSRTSSDWRRIGHSSEAYLESIEVVEEGALPNGAISTGYLDLDRLLGGYYPGNLIVLAARTGLGKSSLALWTLINLALDQHQNVGLFSLEMSHREIAGRALAGLSQIDGARLRTGRLGGLELGRVAEAQERLAGATLWIDDTGGLELRELQSRARKLHEEHPLSLLVIDYLQLVRAPHSRDRVQEVGAVSMALKGLAGELGCPVVALSQLSRAIEQRSSPEPRLSDLRESGNIEQDADVVLFIVRLPESDAVDIHVAKHRNGPTGIIQLLWLPRTARFVNLGIVAAERS